ncbi:MULTISPECIES: hypothetical protein [Sporosarcina]|uniref:YgaB-like protein n=1 Tax=Sporosarcina newyorkensis TaxID=759851 RepID=A0A1T4Y1Z3_9BACL|nr:MULTISPECIES: hypothetical protein [Sporosarcina]MBY0223471.1 hypothetical protein [Sporosarcina aquimarina]SKA95824.1 hypothetical protein SAMN04244570_1709 [Sporosarcina newyorkensis]
MYENSVEELELLKQQLERVKQQDRILAEIERKLHGMKEIAQYAAEHRLLADEQERLDKQMQEHQNAIMSLENYLS